MGRRNKKNPILNGRFMAVPNHIWDSPAMRDCDAKSRVVFLEILRRYDGYNNGHIPLSVREAAQKVNISKGTANNKIHELVKVGLINITKNSGFNMKGRTSREYEITFHPCDKRPAKNTFKLYKKQQYS